jgi:hypothetical protein
MYYTLPNGLSFAHVSRSCTSTLCAHALKNFFPEQYQLWKQENLHSPQRYLEEHWSNRLPPRCLVIVRNPIDRLMSLLSRNHYDKDIVLSCLKVCYREGVIAREYSRSLSICRFHHIAPVTNIAENDSIFVLFPEIDKACRLLDMSFDDTIHENSLPLDAIKEKLDPEFIPLLQDSVGLWEALCKHQ